MNKATTAALLIGKSTQLLTKHAICTPAMIFNSRSFSKNINFGANKSRYQKQNDSDDDDSAQSDDRRGGGERRDYGANKRFQRDGGNDRGDRSASGGGFRNKDF